MLQLNHIQNNKENVLTRLAIKHFDGTKIIDDIIAHDTDRKKTQTELDNTLAILNAVSKEIGQLMAQKKSEEAEVKKKETASLKEEAKQLEEKNRTSKKCYTICSCGFRICLMQVFRREEHLKKM